MPWDDVFAEAQGGSGEALAQQNVALGPPTGFGENMDAGWRAMLYANTTMSYDLALSDEYAKVNEGVRKTSGDVLDNPVEQALSTNAGSAGEDYYLQQYYDYAHQRGLHLPSPEEMSARAHARMRGEEANAANVSARASGPLAKSGGIIGSIGASVADPPVLASMLTGAGEATTIAGAIGREALVAGAAETVAQPVIQTERVQAGLPGGVAQGAENVAGAAVGAGVLGGVTRGVATGVGAAYRGSTKAYRAMRDSARAAKPATSAEEDAARYSERFGDLQGENPLAETPEGAQEHVDRLTDAQTRLYQPDTDVPETRLSDSPDNLATSPAEPVEAQAPAPLSDTGEPQNAALEPPQAVSEEDIARAAADLKTLNSAPPKDQSLFGALQHQVRTRDANGDLTPEGANLMHIIGDNPAHVMRLVNNRQGFGAANKGDTLDNILTKLKGDHWLGPDADLNDLYDLVDREARGEKIYHPTSDIHSQLGYRRLLDEETNAAGITGREPPDEQARMLAEFRVQQREVPAFQAKEQRQIYDLENDLPPEDAKVLHSDDDWIGSDEWVWREEHGYSLGDETPPEGVSAIGADQESQPAGFEGGAGTGGEAASPRPLSGESGDAVDRLPTRDRTNEAVNQVEAADRELDRAATDEEAQIDTTLKNLRAAYEGRADDPVLLDEKTGRTVTAAAVFDELDGDEKLSAEWRKCMGGE